MTFSILSLQSFLISIYDYVFERITLGFVAAGVKDTEIINQVFDGSYHLTLKAKHQILTSNIYGVDLNPYAVEVSKFSLLLKLLEGENSASIENYLSTHKHSTEKWTKYFLNEAEIQLLRKIRSDERIKPSSDIMDVDVGIVTGRNEYFMLTKELVSKWKLNPYTTKVVSKSNHFNGIVFTDVDFEKNSDDNRPAHLFLPENKEYSLLPKVCREYIVYGEEMGFNKGYKCRIRKNWYITPSMWSPDAFVLRQVGDYPKLILNKTDASSTDTIHRVRFKTKVKTEIIALSFLNSLTFAFSEILGRSYGGGVLTFEPTEIEEIPLPLLLEHKFDFKEIDALIRMRKIEEAMDIIDKELLIKQLKFSESEVQLLRGIWKKLADRRNGRRN